MNTKFSFIIIDDSELDCFVTQKFLEHSDKSLVTETFQNAEQALEMIRENPNESGLVSTIILLDLQMPIMNGFSFVEEFEKFSPEIKKNYTIIIFTILSPVAHPNKLYKILTYSTVKGIIEKPLTSDKLYTLLMQVRFGV